jgi:hypothetical protein
LFRGKRAFLNHLGAAVAFYAPEEATGVAFVAYAGPYGLDAHQQGIRVAIHAKFAHLEYVAAGLALLPSPISGAAEEHHLSAAARFLQSLLVHIPEHQDVSVARVLHDCRDQSAGLCECDVHVFSSRNSPQKTKNPLELCASGLMSALFSGLLCTPQQARRVAVMMMVPMRRAVVCDIHGEATR